MALGYAVMHTTDDTFTFPATLKPVSGPPCPADRYQIDIDRRTRELSSPKKIEIAEEDIQRAILTATGETVASSCRFINGSLSISYKVTTVQRPNTAYIVQLCHYGNVTSMDALMEFVQANSKPSVIPMPVVYSIPGQATYQRDFRKGRQIIEFVPGVMAEEEVYRNMPHVDKLEFVRKIALAWQACWDLPLPPPSQIGVLVATDKSGNISLTVGPDRHYSLGGPFTSVREWLKARILHAVTSLEIALGIDDFKDMYFDCIKGFVNDRLDEIHESVEDCPIVAFHVDMGLHNVLVSAEDNTQINAVIDWESCASAPFLAAYDCIDVLFRASAPSGFGSEYPYADELRKAFWDAIPKWKIVWDSQSARDFMEWFQLTLFMTPAYCPSEKSKVEKMEFWAENRRVVEGMLKKHGAEKS